MPASGSEGGQWGAAGAGRGAVLVIKPYFLCHLFSAMLNAQSYSDQSIILSSGPCCVVLL